MKIEAPQIIMIGLSAMSFGIVLVQHGKPREGNYNFWAWLISFMISYALLWWGGFFG